MVFFVAFSDLVEYDRRKATVAQALSVASRQNGKHVAFLRLITLPDKTVGSTIGSAMYFQRKIRRLLCLKWDCDHVILSSVHGRCKGSA